MTADGKEWKYHRRITSTAFTPQNIQLVYSETARQTSRILASWEKNHNNEIVIEEFTLNYSMLI